MKQFVTLIWLMMSVSGCGGSPGAAGANGTNGSSSVIAHGEHCFALDAGTGTSLQFKYDSSTMTNGDRYVSCVISTASQESSYSTAYAAAQPGATTGSCIVNLGVGAADFGSWQFTQPSGMPTAVYSDIGSAHNGYSFTFAAGNCSSF